MKVTFGVIGWFLLLVGVGLSFTGEQMEFGALERSTNFMGETVVVIDRERFQTGADLAIGGMAMVIQGAILTLYGSCCNPPSWARNLT